MFGLFIFTLLIFECSCFNTIVVSLKYSTKYTFNVSQNEEYILEFSGAELIYPPRVSISSDNAAVDYPVMVVARQQKELLSWQLPLIVESDSGGKVFNNISRTLCHDILKRKEFLTGPPLAYNYPIVSVSTSSPQNVSFDVLVDNQFDFHIQPAQKISFTISPSQPRYYFYNFTTNATDARYSNYDTVILKVSSNDTVCMTVSIQNISCPVLDLNQDITFRGFYETVNTQGGITIPKYKFPFGFFVVFVAKGDDFDCTGRREMSEINRNKNITVVITPSIVYSDYLNAVIITVMCILAFYIVFIPAFCVCMCRSSLPREMEYVHSELPTPSTIGENIGDTISVDSDFDTVQETEQERHFRYCKKVVFLSDLARTDTSIIKRRSYLYLYNVLTVAVFYGLPVVQLVITYQNVLNNTGEQDLCYYNFLCAHPLGFISDFNHLFSNIAYVCLGILFLIITYHRERTHKDVLFERQFGIPQHYGMFYAMGVALIMEGVLSGSYHICPNHANFQFDSSFMYVMAVLCIVKLYQNRHTDINATAYSTFGLLAIAILLGMIGIFEGNLCFWIVFTIIYLLMCVYLSAQIYYMGCWKLDRGVVCRVYRSFQNDFHSGFCNLFIPTHKARMSLLIVGNIVNWGLAASGIILNQKDFPLHLLGIFMLNTLLYFFFYITMKVICRERVNKVPILFLILSICCAVSAMYFFLHKSISWAKTPAESRQYNQECKLFHFYDFHDIWHFLSAIGMFFTFMVLLTLDDDLSHTCRSQIHVF